MRRTLLTSACAAFAVFSLSGCGGAALGGGKEGAAQALFQLSSASTGATGASSQALAQGITATGTVTVAGPKGGSATLTFESNAGSSASYSIAYNHYSKDGETFFDGAMDMSIDSSSIQSSGSTLVLTWKGKVTLSGAISDFVDANVTETVDFSQLTTGTSQTVSASVVLNGTISTESATYTYNNETISFTSGELPKA